MSLKTPLYDVHPLVYEPSEDTHLFLDALELDTPSIVKQSPLLTCEVGSGSGVLITALATILGPTSAYFATDVNVHACEVTLTTSVKNQTLINPVAMNLTTCFRNKFDLVLFNPPYVVTEEEEIEGRGLNRAWAGGRDGREITDEFLRRLPDMLEDEGVCYLLLLKENRIKEVLGGLKDKGFEGLKIIERRIPGEHLFVYKIFRFNIVNK